jgi:hypothetical protein
MYFRRPPEAVPILKDESTSEETVVAANGHSPQTDDPREEDIQTENIHSSSTRGTVAQVSLNTSETSYFYVMNTVTTFRWSKYSDETFWDIENGL